ncbi:NADH oxidase, partial [Chloroflexota bacterium]
MKFKKLFEPLMIGTMEVKNRIVMAPMSTHLVKDGFVTEQMKAYYVERAKGGAGMVTVEDAIVQSPLGHHVIHPLLITDDKYISGLKDLAIALKSHGVRAVLHISHGGRRAGRVEAATGLVEATRGAIPIAPSMIAHPAPGFLVPRELTIEEIEELVELFAQAAVRVRKAGFDAIQLHCAHMYLLGEFLSPLSNTRQDKYGGDFEGRFTF